MVLDFLLLLAALARGGVGDMLEGCPGEVETFVVGGTEYATQLATIAQHHFHGFAFELGILAKRAKRSCETCRTDFELEVLLVAVEMFIDILVECRALVEGDHLVVVECNNDLVVAAYGHVDEVALAFTGQKELIDQIDDFLFLNHVVNVIIEKREPIFGPLFFVSRCKDTYYILNTQEKSEKNLIFV